MLDTKVYFTIVCAFLTGPRHREMFESCSINDLNFDATAEQDFSQVPNVRCIKCSS